MEIREIKNKKVWESFLLKCKEKTFLQSWNWGEFNRAMGDKIWRFGVYKNDNLLSVALIIKISAKRGTFLLVPHGPALRSSAGPKLEILNIFLKKLKEITRKEKVSFIRIAPIWQRNEENIKTFKKLSFREAPIHVYPEVNWELDITPSEHDLLMGMRKTTRYLIRQGLKNPDLKIEQSQKLEEVEHFNKLYQETVDRHHFVPFSLDYLKNEFRAFLSDDQISLFFAKYKPPHQKFGSGGKDEVLASAMIIFWQGIAFYHQGASSTKYPKIPVSYLLQWEAIKEAKRRGCKVYNFWGVVDRGLKIKNHAEIRKHPWWGLTLFKMGFGGQKKEYVKTQDLPLSKKYWLTYIFEKIRKIKRGF